MPSIPGVILIEGRIKTLKEFFKVDLLLMNVSSLFTLTDLTARLEVPEGALTPVAPAGGTIALPDIGPAATASGAVHRPRRHQGHPQGDRAFRRQDRRLVPARTGARSPAAPPPISRSRDRRSSTSR